MKYIVDTIIEKIKEQDPRPDEQLRIRISGFEDVIIYEAVAKQLHALFDGQLLVETRLSKEKWEEFKDDPLADQTALLSLEAHNWVADGNSLTYYRNLPLDAAQLIVIMGTEAVDDQGGLNDFYYLDPEKLVAELGSDYYLVFPPIGGGWTEDEIKCVNKLYGDLFALVPINICKFSDLADSWGVLSSIEDFVQEFFKQLPIWGLCKVEDKLPSISKIVKNSKNLLQTNSDFITRKLFKKMTQKQYEKYLTKIALYHNETTEYMESWTGWGSQSLSSLARYTDALCQFIRGERIQDCRQLLLGTDFSITEYVLGITLPTVIVQKAKKYEVTGNPYIAFLKAICTSVSCEDEQPFDSIKIAVSSIELADAVDPLLDTDEESQLEDGWRRVCWFAGGVLEYIASLGFEVSGNEIEIICDDSRPFDPKCVALNVASGLITTASASKKLDKVRFEVTHYYHGKPTDIKHNIEWTFTLHDDWVIAFDQLCAQYEAWDNDQIDAAIPVATVDNYESLMSAKCEEEFLDAFEQSSLDFSINLCNEAGTHTELDKSFEWQAEFSALGRSFISFCRSLIRNGFYADLLQTSKGGCKSNEFVDRYVKLGNLIVNSTFPQKLEWVMKYYIHAFAIEESGKAITSDEEGTGCIIPTYHPAILQKLIDQTVFLADGCHEWLHDYEDLHASFDKICEMIDELSQLSQIQEGVDIFPGKDGSYFGTTQAFANYCICGTCKRAGKKWMKSIMKKDAVFDDDFNDGTFKAMSVSAKMLLDVLETYVKALPNYTTNLSIAVINPEDLQPIIAALYQYINRIKKETGDGGQTIQIRLYILVQPENKGGKNYLSYWANTFFNQDENVDLKIYLNEWTSKDDLEKLLDTNLDLIFLMDVLKFNRLHFARDNGSSSGRISDCRFPIVFKPAPVSAASIKRSIELTQRQFSAATIHSQVVYYQENYESLSYQKELVVKEVSIDAERKELILMLHRKSNWVVCVDGGMDGALLRDSDGKNNDYSVIGFSTGKGPHGQYNLTITARNTIINAVEERLKARLQKSFHWDKAKTYMAAKVCMEEARSLDGISLLSAINPRDENINEFLAYVLASLQAKKLKSASALQVVVHLDSYQHWFESNVLEDEVENSSRPDFLQVSADVGDNGVIQLDATVVECKIAKYDNADERKADAIKQVDHGIRHLAKLFDPHSKSIRRRYWYAQLYRALAFSQITFQSDTQAFMHLSEEMRNILEGNFEIKWSGKIMGYWKDMPGDNEVVTTISNDPIVELHEVPQKKIQRILLDDDNAAVEYAVIEDDPVENDEDEADIVIVKTPRSSGSTTEPKSNEPNQGESFAETKGSRVAFSFDEAVLLLAALIEGRESKWTQSATADKASSILRQYAEKKGAIVTSSFRSPGGLMGRLKSLSLVLDGEADEQNASTKVFTEVANFYKNDPVGFTQRLNQLTALIAGEQDHDNTSSSSPQLPEGSSAATEERTQTEEIAPELHDENASANEAPDLPTKPLEDVRVYIGKDRVGNKVYWDFGHPKLANRHLLITGTSGQGKTYSIQAMLKELAENGVSSVIFDYTEGFREDQLEPAFRTALADKITQNIVYFTGIPINPFRRHEIEVGGMRAPEKISDVAQRIATIFTHVYNFGEQQFGALYSACSEAITSYGDQTDMGKFRDKLKEISNPAAKTVLTKMTPFFDSVDFQPGSSFDWNSIIKAHGSVVIFQLTNYVREIQVVITEMMLWDAWHYFKKNGDKNTPFVVVLDEAQNLSMKMGSPAEIILREGRKFGWSAWFATQSLKSLSDVEVVNLHQAPYSLYFKPTDDEIVKISKQIDPVSSGNWVSYLKGLHKGQCIVTGDRVRPDGTFGAAKPTVTSITSFEERENEKLQS